MSQPAVMRSPQFSSVVDSACDAGAVPIIVGVTGHRNLDHREHQQTESAVEDVLLKLRESCPHTPLAILSPLRSGADQLVMRVAARMKQQHPDGFRLIVVLPWWQAQGADIIPAPESPEFSEQHAADVKTFNQLLTSADQIIEIPLRPEYSGDSRGCLDDAAREIQQNEVGCFIARNCQILLALWDGVPRPDSQTEKMIRWNREGAPAPFQVRAGELSAAEVTAICHIRCRRSTAISADRPASSGDARTAASTDRSSQSTAPENFVGQESPTTATRHLVTWEYPVAAGKTGLDSEGASHHSGSSHRTSVRMLLHHVHRFLEGHWSLHESAAAGEAELKSRWKTIDRFNRDCQSLRETAAEPLRTSRRYLMSDDLSRTLHGSSRRLIDFYALADVSAGIFQSRTRRMVRLLFLIGFLAIAFLETYAHLWHEWPMLVLYLFMLALGGCLYRRMKRGDHQGRWLDYRALAEALRVQIFWHVSGLTDCVADHYLQHFRGELDWVRHASRAVFLVAGENSRVKKPSVRHDVETLKLIRQDWLQDQLKFFRKKAPLFSELEISAETTVRLAFLAAILFSGCHVWYHIATGHMSHPLVLATFGCLVIAALTEEYAEFSTWGVLSRKYRWMTSLFETANHRMDDVLNQAGTPENPDTGRIRRILFELGREALTENADWVVQHRQRPPMLPRG